MNLRMIGLAAVVVTATLVPLVASAGPAAEPRPGTGTATAHAGDAEGRETTGPTALLPGFGTFQVDDKGADGVEDADGGQGGQSERGALGGDGDAVPRTHSRCGPELASADGIEAQTCVLTRGGRTWGRTYHRNATGEDLTAVLTLMAPGGRTVQTNCRVGVADEMGTCETAGEPSRGSAAGYGAVAEFAVNDGTGNGPLLLRSGSNPEKFTPR